MEDYKYTNLRCVRLGDGLGSRRASEPRKSRFPSNKLTHDRGFYQSLMSRETKGTRFSMFPSLPHSATF